MGGLGENMRAGKEVVNFDQAKLVVIHSGPFFWERDCYMGKHSCPLYWNSTTL